MTSVTLPQPIDAPARRGHLRRAAGILATVLTLLAAGAWFTLLRPTTLGGPAQYVVIHGNSMFPTYLEGDLIITRTQPSYYTGEVVAYTVPKGEIGAGHIVIHRIIGGDGVHGFTLQGDNNPSADPWHPTLKDIVGTTWTRVPRAGKLLADIHQPLVLGGIAAGLTVLFLLAGGTARRQPHVDDEVAQAEAPASDARVLR